MAISPRRARPDWRQDSAGEDRRQRTTGRGTGPLAGDLENYPQLRSNENFLRLQDELAGTENRIAIERRRYNETVQAYNTYIQLFPNNIVASIAGFKRNDAYFKADEGSRTAPKVNFGTPTQQPAPAPH